MSSPQWISPKSGTLATIPELQYVEIILDAYDTAGGVLTYNLVSGKLPKGLQVVTTGKIQGIPVSDLLTTGEQTINYRFTIRATNSVTHSVTDRTFTIPVTNIAPPVIIPKNLDLGRYYDGTTINLQLVAAEVTPGAPLLWTITKGILPPGLTLSPTTGLISGYIKSVTDTAAGSTPGWDSTTWNNVGWDFTAVAISKIFNFTIEVSDGVNVDTSTYKILVTPVGEPTADSTLYTIDATLTAGGANLTVNPVSKHYPIITTLQTELIPARQSSYFSFNVDAIDLDGDVLQYTVPSTASGAFDEQVIVGNSLPYISSQLIGSNLFAGVYPFTTTATVNTIEYVLTDPSRVALVNNNIVKVLGGDNLWHSATITNATTVRVVSDTQTTMQSSNLLTYSEDFANAAWPVTGWTVETNSITAPNGNTEAEKLVSVSGSNVLARIFTATSTKHTFSIYFKAGSFTIPAIALRNNTTSTMLDSMLISGGTSVGNGWYRCVASASTGITIGDMLGLYFGATAGVTATQFFYVWGAQLEAESTVGTYVKTTDTVGPWYANKIGKYITQAISGANATITSTGVTTGVLTIANYTITANVGDFITQVGSNGNATVISNVSAAQTVPVTYTSGIFTQNYGNIMINGNNLAANVANVAGIYPSSLTTQSDISVTYNTANTFTLKSLAPTAKVAIAGNDTLQYPNVIVSVGATIGALATEGTLGVDKTKYDQGTLTLPPGLVMDINTGWMVGQIPPQSLHEVNYSFEIVVYKRDQPAYQTSKLFTLTILGDLNNRIDWITPANLGTIQNGKISDLSVTALSTKGKILSYTLKPGGANRLPQGIILTETGLLSGRVSFEMFSFDSNIITIDGGITTFDNMYHFTVVAEDIDHSVNAERTFSITILNRNDAPYENLYLKALLSQQQKDQFRAIMQNPSIFPVDLIYRNDDPFFGLATDIKTLFLAGIAPSTMAEYTSAMAHNHYTKHITFDGVKSAAALDSNFNVKYEVVYVDILDENTNAFSQGPADTINLSNIIDMPYYDENGVAHNVAYPNAFSNMKSTVANALGYENKGALPDWMTSRQPDGRVLGFTRAVVLAYTLPGAGELIAYRFNQEQLQLNEIDFTVDRYELDNNYSANYDIANNKFITSDETTFDRYPGLSAIFLAVGVVDYALVVPFDTINNQSASYLRANGGIDGVTTFKHGDTLVFAQQEFYNSASGINDYNQGWSNVTSLWGGAIDAWDDNTPTVIGWDAANYIPGYNEHNIDVTVPNRRIGIWTINIDANDVVTLISTSTVEKLSGNGIIKQFTLASVSDFYTVIIGSTIITATNYTIVGNILTFIVPPAAGISNISITHNPINLYNKLHVRNGFSHGRTNIYFDSVIAPGRLIPAYSIINELVHVGINATRFDGNGTRFLSYRNSYSVPGIGDKYIMFSNNGVFN